MAFSDDDISKIITALFATYGQSHDGKRIAIYCKVLKTIPADLLAKACNKIILENTFVPVPAEIRKAAESLYNTAYGGGQKSFDEAWEEIERAVWRVGVYRKPEFSTPEIAAVVRAFGWYELCTLEADAVNTVRAQVRRMYEDVCRRATDKHMNAYLLGDKAAMLPEVNYELQ